MGSAVSNSTTAMPSNVTEDVNIKNVSWDDATWIMTSSFIIFTMQSGSMIFLLTHFWIYVKIMHFCLKICYTAFSRSFIL